ncbi:imidazolonepropionase [Janibacter sp. Soil728]|uniref:imidazolonepropionase n=1 Tax=Janibacter sp. Soil728 TaxID=1736393 RepID=UPI0006F796B8|nr:imidazolonepropionase [Janibacter sp. Soil728]KRE35787.1 imidazolonepropionase [Janibacter sp. Soil728]
MSTLVTNIGELVTCDGTGEGGAGARSDMALVVVGNRIAWVGEASVAPAADSVIDVEGRCVTPGFVDSHAHLVFAGDRSAEFAARMAGQAYDGGGIGVSVEATRAADDDWLRTALAARIAEMRAQGTSTVEVKSGYGLTVADEVRALRLAAEVTDEVTYLGAHVVPPEMREDRAAYVDLVTGEMLSACAPHARWIDVFCEPASPHAFTDEESRAVLLAGRAAGLGLRVHGNQLGHGPGVQLACELGAASVDHCTYLSADDVDALVGAAETTTATLLPGVEFSTRSPYPDARALLDAGVSVALASDCNPGTCYSSSIPFVIALAVREMGMTPSEAVVAATRGGARALHRDDIGRIEVGARADLTVLEAPNHLHLSYRAGVPIARVLEV